MKPLLQSVLLASACLWTHLGGASDWPCYQGEARRSAVSSEKLSFPLAQTWEYRPTQPPRPAWPEPGRTLHLMDFDYALQPVAAGGLVFIAASADDTVRALNEEDGRERWHFTARGSLRFAPHLADGRCYFAGDDGFVYCLDAATGRLVWEFRAALDSRMMPGNQRMISRWPCRSGVLVVDGVVYATAGMWPSEGIYLYALDAATGRVLWCNDTSASLYLPHPHDSASFGGPAPQGYLLAAKDVLLVPTGQASPAGFDRRTGRLLYCNLISGGSSVTLAGDLFFIPRLKVTTEDHDVVQLGENGPSEGDGLQALDLATGRLPAQRESRLSLTNRNSMLFHNQTLYAVGGGAVEALDVSRQGEPRRLWTGHHGRAYSMALASDVLILGGAGTITALRAADGQPVWQVAVDGQVRGLAIADGRLLAATEKGTVWCFSGKQQPADKGRKPEASGPRLQAEARAEAAPTDSKGSAAEVLSGLPYAESLRGYALVVGEADARLAELLVRGTLLHVVCVLTNQAVAAMEQDRLLRETDFYGTRLVVHPLEDHVTLPFASYFANLVVVSGAAAGIPLAELYRAARPCGGRMAFIGGDSSGVAQRIRAADIPQSEIVPPPHAGACSSVVRGKLPGAFDWDSPLACDQRVRWPLELLWFGGPGPSRMVARHWKAPTPVFANGRCFILGQYHLIGLDAYNGCELWCRQIGGVSGYKIFKVAANDDTVYANFPDYCAELDAQTGAIKRLYGQPKASPRFSLDPKQSFVLENKGRRLGSVEVSRSPGGIELALTTDLPDASPKDSWQVHLDFRSPEAQVADAGPGAFSVQITPTNGAWRPGLRGPVPRLIVSAATNRLKPELQTTDAAGSTVRMTIPLETVRELLKQESAAFRLAVTLQRFPRGQQPLRVHQFADGLGTFLNDGWGMFVLDASRVSAGDALPVALGQPGELPALAKDWPRQPAQFTAEWTLDSYDRLELDQWPPVERGSTPALRRDPLSGLTNFLSYVKSHGCGGTISSAAADFFRSGTLGIYDRADDSGLRNIPAVRPGCGMTLMPAGGLLLSVEGQADCACSFNFQTSLAMAPAARQRNEDWALFDLDKTPALVRGLALNLGAPGDRRDSQGLLWLGFPRPSLVKAGPPARPKPGEPKETPPPCRLEFYDGFGPYRLNAERLEVRGTDRPWIYASGGRGLKQATLDLVTGQPQGALAIKTTRPPRVDGRLDDACWNGLAPLVLSEDKSTVFLRHDATHLYVGARRAEVGKPFSMDLRGGGGSVIARFTCDTDGQHRSTRWDSALNIPRLDRMTIDGKADDWGTAGLVLPFPGGGFCRLGWTAEGLVMLTELPKGFSAQPPELTGVMALFFRVGSSGFLQCAQDAKSQTHSLAHRIRKSTDKPKVPVSRNVSGLMHWGHPFGELTPASPAFRSESTKTANAMVVETLFPWDDLCVEPGLGRELGFQIIFYDPAKTDPTFATGTDWRPQILAEARNLGRVRLARQPGPLPERTLTKPQRYGSLLCYVVKEDVEWAAPWTASVKADGDGSTLEMAIPWQSLAEAGIHQDKLALRFSGAERGSGSAQQLATDFDRSAHPVSWEQVVAASRPHTVRLHFCELDEVKPGERVFDVKLQGKVVEAGLDIASAAGGIRTALIREFRGIQAGKNLSVELVPHARSLTERNAPILSGIEVVAENLDEEPSGPQTNKSK